MTIRDVFDEAVAEKGASTFLGWNENGAWKTMTYAAFASRVVAVHAAVRKMLAGVVPDATGFPTRVVIMRENSPDWLALYLAVAGSGLIAVPVDPKLREDEVRHVLGDSGAALVFKDDTNLDDAIAGLTAAECRASAALWAAHKPSADSVASIIYTSGTTGRPKGAMLTHANFCANADQVFPRVMFYETDKFMLVLPLFHAFAFTLNFLMPLRKKAEIVFARNLRTVAPDIVATRPTTLMAVPLLAEMLFRFAKDVICSLRVLGVGGAPLAKATIDGLRAAGVYVLEGYGITECAPGVCYPKEETYLPGTVGVPLDGMEWRICNSDETGAGELRVKGPNVMRGYWNNPQATAEAFDEAGFYRTGDIVRTGRDGNMSICGRIKALIVNREGKNIYPEEIERVLEGDAVFADVIAVGYTKGGESGEHVGVIAVPQPDGVAKDAKLAGCSRDELASRLRKRILARCHESLADYKLPRKVEIRFAPLERTQSQKIKRYLYRRALDE